MSFGASPSDIIIVVTFCRALYRKCRSAGGEYDEISREVRGLHTVLKHLKYEVEAPDSPLNRDHSLWGRQLAPIIGDCDFTLRQLDELLQKYGRLGTGGSSPSSPSSARVLWERMKFGSNEMDTLGEIRVKMISHKTTLTLFLDTIQLRQSGQVSQKLDFHGGQLDVILDKVDNIAARMGHREGSIMTSYDDDDKEVWKQFRRELVAEGFSSDVLQQHKDVLRAYIREIDQNGLLEEPRTPTPPTLSSEKWIDSVHSATSEDVPPSFSSLGSTNDTGTKELMVREDNMKFPQSMKLELRQPETHQVRSEVSQTNPDMSLTEKDKSASNIKARPITIPVPSQFMFSDEKEAIYQNTDGSSSDEESEHGSSSKDTVIRTSDLLAMTSDLQLQVPGSSPSAKLRNSLASHADDEALRSMAVRPKTQVKFGSSPSQSDGIAIQATTLKPSLNVFSTSPRPDATIKLAPDQYGNAIRPDAMWTKISRSLVSPEVLQQDGRRYEARPDFVAVLGILSRAEIEALTARSQALRSSRGRRSMLPKAETEIPPPQPPRPIAVQQPSFSFDSASRAQDGRDTSSSSSNSSASESESDSDYKHRHRRRNDHSRRTSNLTPIPVKRHSRSYGAPPPPLPNSRAPHSTAQQAMYMSGGLGVGDTHQSLGQPQSWSYNYNSPIHQQQPNDKSSPNPSLNATNWGPPPLSPRPNQQYTQQYPVRNDREFEQEYVEDDRDRNKKPSERERGQHRRHSSNQGGNREHRNHNRHGGASQTPRQGKHSRWKENLTSAGIGGAAATLLNVLTEAAEAL